MKIRNIIVFIAAFMAAAPALSMQISVAKQNQQLSDANQQAFANQPYLTLAVIQPTPGYRSLETHVKNQNTAIKNAGYGQVPSQDWHLSVMVFAVPFPQQPSLAYAQQALDHLAAIIDGYKKDLSDVEFQYTELKSLGSHKFLVAEYERVGRKPFFSLYADIVHDFMQTYPQSWMYYGYDMVPHVSVASKMKSAGAASATMIQGAPRSPIKNLQLRHKGRKLEISARYFDTNLNKLVELTSNPI